MSRTLEAPIETKSTAPSDLNAKMWKLFVNSLVSQGGLQADPTQFLATNGLALANWQVMNTTGLPPGNPNAKPGDPNVPGLEAWADAMPLWNQTYVPGDGLYNNYVAFLNAIKLTGGDPAQQQIADGYAVNLKNARTQLAGDQLAMFTAWVTFNAAQASIPPASQTSFNDWYNQNWQSTITGDQSNISAANTNYLTALQAVGGPDYATLSAALSKAALSASAGNGILDPATSISMPYYTVNPGLNDWFVQSLQTVTSSKPPQVDFTIDLSQAASSSSSESSYLNTSASGSYFFWGGSASHSQSQSASDYSSFAQNLKMRYQAQTLTQFSVTPGSWYNAAMIKGFYDKISPNSAFANKPLFGKDGLLNLRAAQIYVAFKRTITLSGLTQTMSQLRSAFAQQSHASVSVGGFFWSGSASVDQGGQNSSASVAWSSDGTSVTISDNSNAPKVIGIVPQNLKP
jgi:hypothetical protein